MGHEQLIVEFDADAYPYGPIDFPAGPTYPEHLDPTNPVENQIADPVVDAYLSGQVN